MRGRISNWRCVQPLLSDLIQRWERAIRANPQQLILDLPQFHASNKYRRREPRILQDALPEWREKFRITLDANSYWNGYTPEDLKKYVVSGAGVSHAAEFETSLLMAAFPDRVRRFTMEEYTNARLDFDKETVLTPMGENARDRARQEQALLATVEKGQALLTLATRFVEGKLRKMIAATEAGKPWTGAA